MEHARTCLRGIVVMNKCVLSFEFHGNSDKSSSVFTSFHLRHKTERDAVGLVIFIDCVRRHEVHLNEFNRAFRIGNHLERIAIFEVNENLHFHCTIVFLPVGLTV